MIKYSEINNVKEEGLILAYTSRVECVTVGKSWRQEPEETRHIASTVKKQREILCTLAFSLLLHVIQSRMEWSLLQTKMALPTLINIFKIILTGMPRGPSSR